MNLTQELSPEVSVLNKQGDKNVLRKVVQAYDKIRIKGYTKKKSPI